ncbi:MAG: phosphate ABC transporter permease PstA [Coriobacteriia bacterium]|nr:phosphate ABC transporter permease PstA [Coriobacteriia bacterium]
MSLERARMKRTKAVDRVVTVALSTIAALFVVLLAVIMAWLLYKGAKAATPDLLSFTGYGVGIQLFNTVYLVTLSLLITVPIGICAGIYLAEYAGKGPIIAVLRTCIEMLSSLPSIIVGLFGFLVLIQMTHSKWNLLAGALALAILNVPLIARTTEDALRAVDRSYYDGSIGLGATRWQTTMRILVRASVPRIITGVILAAGRGFGEAAVLIYTSGMNSAVNFNNWNPASITSPLNILRPADTLAVHIWALKTEGIMANANQIADLSAAVLVILVLVFSLSARWMGNRFDKKMSGGK